MGERQGIPQKAPRERELAVGGGLPRPQTRGATAAGNASGRKRSCLEPPATGHIIQKLAQKTLSPLEGQSLIHTLVKRGLHSGG